VVLATRQANQYTVLLTTSAQTAGNTYTLTVTGVQDPGGRTCATLQKTYTAQAGFRDDFESGAMSKWVPSTSANWEVLDDGGDKSLHCRTNTAERLMAPVNFGTFTLTCDVKGEGTSVYRNNCVVFGYQDTSNYYYVQFAGSSTITYNGIFKVTNNVTTKVAGIGSAALLTETASYHAIKLTVDQNTGLSSVWFDGNQVFTLMDNTYAGGQVGVWCKTKTGFFDNVRVQCYLDATVGIRGALPVTAALDQNRDLAMTANPVLGSAVFTFVAGVGQDRWLDIYTQSGINVRRMKVPAGQTTLLWDGRDAIGQRVEPGVYLVKCGLSIQKSVFIR
jgi:hypothetical protein